MQSGRQRMALLLIWVSRKLAHMSGNVGGLCFTITRCWKFACNAD